MLIGNMQFIISLRFIFIFGVGFCVARSTLMGNAKALDCGTRTGTDSRAFFMYFHGTELKEFCRGGARRTLNHSYMDKTKILAKVEVFKKWVKSIPEFPESTYKLLTTIFATLITASGLFLIYEIVTTDTLEFSANWNMFSSPLGAICMFIGFFCAIIFWGKFGHWSSTPVIETRDRFTGKLIKTETNYDLSEYVFAQFLMPIIGHFIIEPIIYGAIIYYPIQCVIAIVGTIFPYLFSLVILGIIAIFWLLVKKFQFRYRSVVLVAAGVLFTIAFAWGAFSIKSQNDNVFVIDNMENTNQIDNLK